MNLEQYINNQTYKLCIFGRAKIGKTTLAAQLAKIWKLWYLDLEGGIKTAIHQVPKEFHKNIEVIRIPSSPAVPMGAETVGKIILQPSKEHKVCFDHGKIDCTTCAKIPNSLHTSICLAKFTPTDCLVLDSTTQLSVDVNRAVLRSILANKVTPEEFILDRDTGGKDFKYPMATAMYLENIFGALQSYNINVVVISHEVMTEQLKDTGHAVGKGESQPSDNVERIFPAAGSRNFSRNFGRYFDALIHLDIVNRQHRAFTSTTYSPVVQTGSRLEKNLEDFKGADGKPLSAGEALIKLVTTSGGK